VDNHQRFADHHAAYLVFSGAVGTAMFRASLIVDASDSMTTIVSGLFNNPLKSNFRDLTVLLKRDQSALFQALIITCLGGPTIDGREKRKPIIAWSDVVCSSIGQVSIKLVAGPLEMHKSIIEVFLSLTLTCLAK
jgi:hypothetical protein